MLEEIARVYLHDSLISEFLQLVSYLLEVPYWGIHNLWWLCVCVGGCVARDVQKE